jgi:hypothetical protein
MKRSVVVSFLSLAVSLCACGPVKKKPAGSAVNSKVASAQADKAAAVMQKPADAMMTSAAPKPIPTEKSAGSTTVKPPDPTSGGTAQAITYAFTNIDLDDDGDQESGVLLATADLSTVLMWWTGTTIFTDGEPIDYEGFLWVAPSTTGVVMDFAEEGTVACADGVCVACSSDGATCVVQQ